MITRVLRPALTLTAATAVVLAALVVFANLNTGVTRADSTYPAAFTVTMCNSLTDFSANPAMNGSASCTEDLISGNNANFTTELDISAGLNFSNITTFNPENGVVNTVAVGTQVGGLNSTVGLGIGNNTCAAVTDVEFNLFSVALPNNANARLATNIAYPQQEGASNRFERWKVATGDFTTPAWATIGDGIIANGATPYAISSAIPIQNYPIHMLNLLDPDFVPGVGDGSGLPLIPVALYGGVTKVAGTWVPLFFAQFAAGGMSTLPAPFSNFTSAMGSPSASVLNDPTSVKAFPSTITDFCTPINVVTMFLGDPDGGASAETRWENPPQGTGFFVQYAASLRDLDQDGYENALDPCPAINEFPAATSNPKQFGGNDPLDDDGDGIPDSCDPTTTSILDPFFIDEDNDGFSNRGDNCPLVANGDPFSVNPAVTPGVEPGQIDDELGVDPADGGPRTDSIGNACDDEKGTITVHHQNTTVSGGVTDISITLADNVANGRWMSKTNVQTKCFRTSAGSITGGADNDGDGYCNLTGQDKDVDGATGDSCLLDSPVSCSVRHSSWLPSSPPRQTDTDSDSYNDGQETYYGTDPVKSCAISSASDDEILDNWPLDFNDDQIVTGSDVLKFGGGFGKSISAGPFGPLTGERLDLNVDGIITGSDILQMGGGFGKTCGVTGGAPPAFSQQ